MTGAEKGRKNKMSQIRKEKTRNGSHYRAVVRYKGYYKSQTFDDKDAAKIWANDLENQLKKGKYKPINDTKIKTITSVKELIDDFEKNIAPERYSRPQQYKVMYNWWRDKIGNLNLSDLNSSVLTQCKNILMSEPPDKPYKEHETKSNSTVRKYLFALSAILRYAEHELEIIDFNPMSRIRKPKKSKGVVRFLSDEERKKLLNACKAHSDTLFLFVTLAIYSGGRYSELLKLRVEDIDFNNDMLHFLQTKNGESRGVPIYNKVSLLLKEYIERYNITSGQIFLNKKKNNLSYLKGSFEKVIAATKITNFRFHDLRHTYASYLAQNGAELLEIAQLMGHKNLNQVQIYAHLTQKHTAKVVRKMSANQWDFD